MMQNKKYFCYEIFKNISVWSMNGQIGFNPCSLYQGYYHKSNDLDITEAWNSPGRQQLIEMIKNDVAIPGCEICYRAERQGLESRRLAMNENYEVFHGDKNIDLSSPQGLDYSIGNLCNLKCVTCDPENSTQWIPDYQKLHPEKNLKSFKFDKHNQTLLNDPEALKNIKSVHFHGGGEPLLSSFHRQLLECIKQAKGLQDVRVFYNVNGTQTVDQEILDLWENCRLVELYFSIDGIGQRFDYLRTNADWNQILENLLWFQEKMPHNHMFNINCTWSYLNLYYLDEVYQWYEENFKTNRYGDPINLIFQKALGVYSIDHISQKTSDLLLEKFSRWPELIKIVKSLEIKSSPHTKFWENINRLDQIRETNFRTIFPEWSSIIS